MSRRTRGRFGCRSAARSKRSRPAGCITAPRCSGCNGSRSTVDRLREIAAARMSAILVAVDGPQAGEWLDALRAHAKGRELRVWPDAIGDPDDIAYACVWLPPHGLLARFPNLKAIINLGAGVDHLLADPALARGADGARRASRPHHAGDRIRRAACADASSAAAALRRAAARAALARARSAGRERGCGRRHGSRRDRQRCRGGARAARLQGCGLEPHAQDHCRCRDLSRAGRPRCLSGAHRNSGLPAAADARHRRAS